MKFPNDWMKLNEWSGFLFSSSYEQHFALCRFAQCCLTWMAWAPGAQCSHGFFVSFFPRLYLNRVVRKKRRWDFQSLTVVDGCFHFSIFVLLFPVFPTSLKLGAEKKKRNTLYCIIIKYIIFSKYICTQTARPFRSFGKIVAIFSGDKSGTMHRAAC